MDSVQASIPALTSFMPPNISIVWESFRQVYSSNGRQEIASAFHFVFRTRAFSTTTNTQRMVRRMADDIGIIMLLLSWDSPPRRAFRQSISFSCR